MRQIPRPEVAGYLRRLAGGILRALQWDPLLRHCSMAGTFVTVVCPTCFESFEVQAPAHSELPAEWDYDCEICCRPMVIAFTDDDGEIVADARGIGE